MGRAYSASAVALSGVLVVLGLVMATTAIASSGGPFSLGVVAGVAFAALGAGRLFLARRMARGER